MGIKCLRYSPLSKFSLIFTTLYFFEEHHDLFHHLKTHNICIQMPLIQKIFQPCDQKAHSS